MALFGKTVKINQRPAVPAANFGRPTKKRRLRFVAVALGTSALLLLTWRTIPAFPTVTNSGWTLFLMMLSYGVLATVLNFWLSLSKLEKATSVEIISTTGVVVEKVEDRPQWMTMVMDVAAAAYLGGLFAALMQLM